MTVVLGGCCYTQPGTHACWVSGGVLCCPVALWPLLVAACSDGPCLPGPVPPTVLLDEIEAAELEGNDDRIEGVLCGAVRQLKAARAKPDSTLYLSLMYLAKIKPNIFATEGVIEVRAGVASSVLGWVGRSWALSLASPSSCLPEAHWLCPRARRLPGHMHGLLQALCGLLRRDNSINFKAKGNSLVSVLACNLLMAAYEEDENWPEIFVKVSCRLLGGSEWSVPCGEEGKAPQQRGQPLGT